MKWCLHVWNGFFLFCGLSLIVIIESSFSSTVLISFDIISKIKIEFWYFGEVFGFSFPAVDGVQASGHNVAGSIPNKANKVIPPPDF